MSRKHDQINKSRKSLLRVEKKLKEGDAADRKVVDCEED
jgi:hypothetical protein